MLLCLACTLPVICRHVGCGVVPQVGFCPLGPAALSLRMVHTLFTLKGDGRPDWHLRAAVLLASWVAACATQVGSVWSARPRERCIATHVCEPLHVWFVRLQLWVGWWRSVLQVGPEYKYADVLLLYCLCCLPQVVLGYSLKWLAYLYVRHHTLQAGGKALPRAINVTPSGVKLFAPSGVPATVSSAAKGPSAAAAAGAVGGGTFGGAGAAAAGAPTGAVGVPTPSLSPLNPSFSPKGSVAARVVTGGLSATGTQTHGGSPTYSPKGSSSVPQLLSAQLQVPGALFNGGTGLVAAGRSSSRFDQLSSSLQGASSGPHHYPGAASADPLEVKPGPLQHLQPGVLSAVQLPAPPLIVGTGSDSSTSSSGSGVVGGLVNGLHEGAIQTHPALIAASLAAPPAASASISIPAAAAADSRAAAAAAPDLQTLSLPPRLGISLTQRAGSTPDSAFSPGSQLQPFADQPAHMRASFSDGGSGWDTSAGTATTVAAMMPSTDGSSVAAVGGAAAVSAAGPSSAAGTAGVAGGTAAPPVSVIARSKAAASGAHSSSYSELSAAGLFDRGHLKQQQGNETDRGVQQQQEQGWQQPKHRHRAKRE